MSTDRADAVRLAVVSAMSERQWGVGDLSRESGLDLGTVGDFVAGKTRARGVTLSKLEAALGLPSGRLAAIAAGINPAPSLAVFEGQRGDVNIVIVAAAGIDKATEQDMIDAAMAVYRAHRRDR